MPGSSPVDGHAGGAPAAREPEAQVEIRVALSTLPQRGQRQRLMERPARGHETHEQLRGQVQEARLPWAQPARLAARVRAKCKQKGQSLSPADKRDHPCFPLRPPPVARVPQQEGPAPEAQLHWTQPDRGTASGRAKGGGAPEYEGSGSAKVSPLRRTAAEAALGWAQDLPRRAVSRAGSVPHSEPPPKTVPRRGGRQSPRNDGSSTAKLGSSLPT